MRGTKLETQSDGSKPGSKPPPFTSNSPGGEEASAPPPPVKPVAVSPEMQEMQDVGEPAL